MAKIIFSTASGIANATKLPCFYEGFVRALARNGNQVMLMVTNDFLRSPFSKGDLKNNINSKKLEEDIIKFNPDLVISANGSLYDRIANIVDCPIVIYGVDSPELFSNKEFIKKNTSRFDLLMASSDFIKTSSECFGYNAKSLNLMHFATDFISEDKVQNTNISFIGTDFGFSTSRISELIKESPKTREILRSFFLKIDRSYLNNVEILSKTFYEDKDINTIISFCDFLNILSSNVRIEVLSSISDLGLGLYGSSSWADLSNVSINLSLSYDSAEISSLKENQDIYNSSKISINISHVQAGSALPWRARDIMASNSVLLSDNRSDLKKEFGKYVDIPTYNNAYEARVLCDKLLKDDIWRKEIVQNSQIAIDAEHRFEHRFKFMQDLYGIKLLSDNESGGYSRVNVSKYDDHAYSSLIKPKYNSLLKISNRVRINIFRKLFSNKRLMRVFRIK